MIRIAIADDHALVRQGLKQVFGDASRFVIAGEAADGEALMRLVREAAGIDVLILDVSMPGRSGIDLIREVRACRPDLPILILSMHHESQYGVRAVNAGASGYLGKGSSGDELIAAVETLARGGSFVTPGIAQRLARQRDAAEVAPHRLLSDREYQIFEMIVAGISVSGIAERLDLSIKTVSTYKTRVLQKMQMESAADLVRYAVERGLVSSASR